MFTRGTDGTLTNAFTQSKLTAPSPQSTTYQNPQWRSGDYLLLERVKVSHSFVISRYNHNDIGIVYKHRNDLEFDQTHPNVLMQDFGGFLLLVRLVEAENLDLV